MKILIARIDDNIICSKDFTNIRDKGEIAHIITELESIKQELLLLWEEYETT